MYEPIIDSHIHIDQYWRSDRGTIFHELPQYNAQALIAVSTHLKSAHDILAIASKNKAVKPALGFHPEQSLPKRSEIDDLIKLIKDNRDSICAIGEVGLPYYLKEENLILSNEEYVEVLTRFIRLAQKLNKPLALHAIYDDAAVVCHLLEEHSIKQAHFHWYKGSDEMTDRLIHNGYHISITPDVLYEKRTMDLVQKYPLHLMMVETDGPWEFDGPFKNQMTHPKMIHQVIEKIGKIKQLSYEEVAKVIYDTTADFYGI